MQKQIDALQTENAALVARRYPNTVLVILFAKGSFMVAFDSVPLCLFFSFENESHQLPCHSALTA